MQCAHVSLWSSVFTAWRDQRCDHQSSQVQTPTLLLLYKHTDSYNWYFKHSIKNIFQPIEIKQVSIQSNVFSETPESSGLNHKLLQPTVVKWASRSCDNSVDFTFNGGPFGSCDFKAHETPLINKPAGSLGRQLLRLKWEAICCLQSRHALNKRYQFTFREYSTKS